MKLKNQIFKSLSLILAATALSACGTFQDQSGIQVKDPNTSNSSDSNSNSNSPPTASTASTATDSENDTQAPEIAPSPSEGSDEDSDEIVVTENEMNEIVRAHFERQKKNSSKHHIKIIIRGACFEKSIEIDDHFPRGHQPR